MSRRRRRRPSVLGFLLVLVVGIGLGGAALNFFWRSRAPETLPPGDPALAIEVLNGCGIAGVADRVATQLRRGGFQVVRVGNADHFHYREDVVVARKVPLERAQVVAKWLTGAVAVEQRIDSYPFDITVVVGEPHPVVPQ